MNRILLFFLLLFSASVTRAQSRPQVSSNDPIVRIYPNPATSIVNLDLSKVTDKGFTLHIFNFLGRKMYETTASVGRAAINLADYQRGIYIYQLRDRSGKLLESGKFQVSK